MVSGCVPGRGGRRGQDLNEEAVNLFNQIHS